MAKSRTRAERPDDFPRADVTPYKIADDELVHLIYNARGGIYRATEARQVEGQTAGQRVVATGVTFTPGLNRVGEALLTRLRERDGFKRRVEQGEIVELGPLGDWPELKPTRAIDYIKNSGDLATLQAIAELEDRDKVAQVLERQIAEISTDRGTRVRARALQRTHSRQG